MAATQCLEVDATVEIDDAIAHEGERPGLHGAHHIVRRDAFGDQRDLLADHCRLAVARVRMEDHKNRNLGRDQSQSGHHQISIDALERI